MNKDSFLSQVINLIVEKSLQGKLRWSVAPALVRSVEVGSIRAEFRMATSNDAVLGGEWDRFIVYQQERPLGQVFNARKYPLIKGKSEQQFVPKVDSLFHHLVVEPREESLRRSLEALSKL